MVYGAPLTVPGDLVAPPEDAVATAEFLRSLREDVSRLRPTPASRHGVAAPHMPSTIQDADFVFIRHDGHRGPLQRVYQGPFRVLERRPKTFILDVGGRREVVSVDRLKRAISDGTSLLTPAAPPRRGRPPTARPTPRSRTPSPRPPPVHPPPPLPTVPSRRNPGELMRLAARQFRQGDTLTEEEFELNFPPVRRRSSRT